MALPSFLPFSSSTTPLQATTYLLGISLFSISFLVFLNSSISFVITDLIGVKKGVGDIVGTLGFVDEIVALIACPIWGLVSDRLGVRTVAVIGYSVIGVALFLFVQARNVYPQLLLARILFAVGATAAYVSHPLFTWAILIGNSATMVTAILPSLTDDSSPPIPSAAAPKPTNQNRHSLALSTASEVTITPERYRQSSQSSQTSSHETDSESATQDKHKPSSLAGYVGLFTGCGALVALSLFLPLPTRFGKLEGVTMAQAVTYSFYVVGAFSLAVAIFVGFGLRDLRGEEGKGWRMLLGLRKANPDGTGAVEGEVPKKNLVPYWHLLRESVVLGFVDSEIAIGYLGGFVARASTVAISLFIPLFVNAFFIREGYCQGSPNDPSEELKKECGAAYKLAAALTGVAQLIGLICAPLFGYLSSRTGSVNFPLIVATTFGIAGYIAFPQLQSPEFKDENGRGGGPVVFLLAALIGISQIGSIVCSLGSLGRGVLKVDIVNVLVNQAGEEEGLVIERPDQANETAPLLERPEVVPEDTVSRVRLKGSVAGVYSWCGGAAILLLTKLGGYLFDVWDTGAPFYLMAVFNGLLLVAVVGIDIAKAARNRS